MTSYQKIIPTDKGRQEDLVPHYGIEQQHLQSDTLSTGAEVNPSVPDIFASLPPIQDTLVTDTSLSQNDTVQICLPLLKNTGKSSSELNSYGIPSLKREDHIKFLKNTIQNARYIVCDAVRPWVIYWSLTGLSALNEDVKAYRKGVIETLTAMQNSSGGFGGGPSQISHCAPSYAAVLSLAMVGGSEGLDFIDRRALWRWLGQLKQSDGGFKMSVGGEEDVRGAYCSMVIISLLALPLELPPNAPTRTNGFITFLDGLPEYLSRCQTFEGGISAAPQTEAHGAYVFCALACLCIIGPPREMIPKHLDLPLLLSWLASRQYAPEGGFSGRTNKLVDGCYSHWVGGCWPLIEAALNRPRSSPEFTTLYGQEGLARYILSCCQEDAGGLRDKPSA